MMKVSSKHKKRVLILVHVLIYMTSFLVVYLTISTRFFEDDFVLTVIVFGLYIAISVTFFLVYWNLSKEFRIKKEVKRLKTLS